MAQWVTANLKDLLPSVVTTALDSIETLLSVISIPLNAVSALLDAAKTFLLGLPPLNPAALLSAAVESIKEQFLATGLYVCNMWDYPVRQLEHTDIGPDATFGRYNTRGTDFRGTFVRDLNLSFDDQNDFNRPQFTESVAMVVLVTGAASLEDLGVSMEEDNFGFGFAGMDPQIGAAAASLVRKRWQLVFDKMRQAAENQESRVVSTRRERVEYAHRLFLQLEQDQIDAIPPPFDSTTGDAFYETTQPTDIEWEEMLEIIETIEGQFEPPVYPDWERVALVDLHPGLVSLINNIFDPVLDLLEIGSSIKDAIIAMIDAIKDKLDELQTLIDAIDDILAEIDRLLEMTGLSALYVSSNTGITDLRTKLIQADNVPFDGNGFYAGMALLAGAANATVFKTLFGPVGS
jgi:hypothetical protein